jgi:hypothetical protein
MHIPAARAPRALHILASGQVVECRSAVQRSGRRLDVPAGSERIAVEHDQLSLPHASLLLDGRADGDSEGQRAPGFTRNFNQRRSRIGNGNTMAKRPTYLKLRRSCPRKSRPSGRRNMKKAQTGSDRRARRQEAAQNRAALKEANRMLRVPEITSAEQALAMPMHISS